jgi:transcriptional regulator with XRE-family HTH domain
MLRTLGDRVRELRARRGLSQSGLARDLVSPSYVSLIEAGKRLPEREILQAFAERLGTTPEYLETGVDAATARSEVLALRYADLALANGHVAEALRRYEQLAQSSLTSRHAAQWGSARGLEAQGDLAGAIGRVEWLLDEHRAGRADAPGLLTLFNAQCRLYREVGDVHHSVTVGERALEEVRRLGLTGTEDEIRLTSTLVASYWERGDWVRANQLAGEVIERAEAQGSPRSRGSAYWNASLAASSTGGLALAIELAERAIAMFSETDDERSIARLRTDFAWLLLSEDPPDLARVEAMLTKAHARLSEIGVDTDLAYCETELARYHLVCGDAAEALSYADRSIARLGGLEVLESARVRVVRAHALTADDRPDEGLAAVRDAVRLLHRCGGSRQNMTTWREAAELLVRLGSSDEAIDAYRALADCANAPLAAWVSAAAANAGARLCSPTRVEAG